MEPRKALITSAAVAATLVSASAAMALNGGILDTGDNDGVGTLNPTMVTVEETTTSLDVPEPVAVTASDSPAVTTSSASTVNDSSSYGSDDSYDHDGDDDAYDDDDSYEDESDDDEYDDDSREYEGYDHDD